MKQTNHLYAILSGAALVCGFLFAGCASTKVASSWSPVKLIDFTSKHNVLIQNSDGTTTPMDEPYFTSKQIAPGTWQIQGDGDYCYLVEGDDEAVMIDTGYGAGNVREYAQTLTSKPIHNVINTHYHFDHTAGDAYFDCVYLTQETKDKATIPYPSFNGVSFPRNYPTVMVSDGYVYPLKGRNLLVLEIPNHTEGGIALLDTKERILFSGDEFMGMGININTSVEQFEKNMEKVESHRSEFDTIAGGPGIMDGALVEKYLSNAQYILSRKGTAVKALDAPKGNYQPQTVTASVPEGTTVYIRGRVRPEDGGPAPATQYTMIMEYDGCKLTYDSRKMTEGDVLLTEYNDKIAAGDFTGAFTSLQKAADVGSNMGMVNLGAAYLYGYCTKQDFSKAMECFTKAEKAGVMKAPRYLGIMYEKGYGVSVDYAKAFAYYTEAAENGDITGSQLLGSLYERGLGTTQDYAKAFEWYTKAAARGDHVAAPGMRALASLYERGLGTTKDSAKAAELIKKADEAEYASDGVQSVTAITEVFGDGQKVSAIAVQYKGTIDNAKLLLADYASDGKQVTAVYANTVPEKRTDKKGVDGSYVIIEFDTSVVQEQQMPAGPQQNQAPQNADTQQGAGGPQGGGGPQLGQKSDKPATAVTLTASLIQHFVVMGTDGTSYTGWSADKTSSKTVNLIVQDFKQFVYHDPAHPEEPLMYNLYVPANYDASKKYPLVLFMHDAGVVSNNPTETLTQGNGATIWATPESQAEHPAFVLAPQYNCVIADDNSQTAVDADITVDLINSLMTKYSIDADRLYDTGQSMGGMTSIALDIKYPHFFAASLLVACQWDDTKVSPMFGTPLWIVVSEGDSKALPGQTAITDALKKLGATVTKCTAYWNAEGSAASLAQEVSNMRKTPSDIYFTVFKGGSHRYTWQYAYSIKGLRDWLFEQKK
jgi:predicted peptidase/glyoxylase-like metal-dependent hydrolase (beta-lactamase superfamily II)